MAISSSQTVETFSAQGLEQRCPMMNARVTNHLGTMDRASVREIMLQHEKTFKEQVQDLHKLYGRQKLLMAERIKNRGQDAYVSSVPPPSPLGNGNAEVGEINVGQRIDNLEQAMSDRNRILPKYIGSIQMPCNLPKSVSEWMVQAEEIPKNGSGPARKRKIDLEQPPEDDSDDEMENSVHSWNPPLSCSLGNFGEPPVVCSGFRALSQQPLVSRLDVPVQLPTSVSPSNCGAAGDLKVGIVSRSEPSIRSSPSCSPNLVNTERTLVGFSGKNLSFCTSGTIKCGGSPSQNNTVFSPQAGFVDKSSQEAGRQAHWIFQSPKGNIVDIPMNFTAQRQQSLSSYLAPSEQSCSMSHSPPPQISQRQNNKSVWFEPVNSAMCKVGVERHSSEASCRAPKDTDIATAERLGDASYWFLKESCSYGSSPAVNIVSTGRCESGALAQGEHSMARIVAPMTNNVLNQEQDVSVWTSKNSVFKSSPSPQQLLSQPQIGRVANQSPWVQSSPMPQNNMYHGQHIMYGVHMSDPSQTGYQNELLQKNQGDVAAPWNMIGLGHYYSGIHSPPSLTPPYKRPPKLVLKSDGTGMELKLASPEEGIEKMEKMPSISVKIDSLQVLPKTCEIEEKMQKELGQGVMVKERVTTEKKGFLQEWTTGSAREVKEYLTMDGRSTEPTLVAEAPCSSVLAFSTKVSASVLLPSTVHLDRGALALRDGSESLNIFASQNERILREHGPQSETKRFNSESEKVVEQRIMNLTTSGVGSDKQTSGQMSSDAKDMPVQQGGRLITGEVDMDTGIGTIKERKESSNKLLRSEAALIGEVTTCHSQPFDAAQQDVRSKHEQEAVANEIMHRAQMLKEDKGIPSKQCATPMVHQESSGSKVSFNAESSHSTDQQVTREVSVQSTSTDKPSILRQARKRSLKHSDALHKVSERLSGACKNESGSPLSDKDCASAASPATLMSDRKSETKVGVVNEDFQDDTDSDNLAASILLSFVPKLDMSQEDKQPKDTASEFSSSIGKVKAAGHRSKLSRTSEDRVGSHLDHSNSANSCRRRIKNAGGIRRVDWTDYHSSSKVTIDDRHRRDGMSSSEQRAREGDAHVKSLTIKLPRVAGSTLNDDSIPISRSKQLSKLNGASNSLSPVESTKNLCKPIKAIHTPTGRRSSRGPLVAARGSFESKRLSHPQTKHCVESSPSHIDNDSATKEGVFSINKLEINMKSKARGEFNRTRNHPRKQFFESLHRKSQK